MKCLSIFIAAVLISTVAAQAQITPKSSGDSTFNDTPLITKSEKTRDNEELVRMYASRFNPRKAGLYSALLPGFGQAYNKKYWKIPIIYGGLAGFAYAIDFYHRKHKQFRTELFDILQSKASESASGFSEDQLRTLVDKARRERDYFIVLTGILYLLNVADAHIDAHLKEFDLNEKLKLAFDPMIHWQNQLQAGLFISLNFQ